MPIVLLLAALTLITAPAAPLWGHHSLSSEFDLNQPLRLDGVVSRVDWGNPHALLFVDVRNPQSGTVRTWALQLPSPSTFRRLGWSREAFQPGLLVRVNGYAARDGAAKGCIHSVTSSGGQILFEVEAEPLP